MTETQIKEEEHEPVFFRPLDLNEPGGSKDMPILLDDHDTHPAPAVKSPSPPLTLPSRRADRRGKEQFRLLRKRLREGFSNDGYGPAPSHPAPREPTPYETSIEEEIANLDTRRQEGQADLDEEMMRLELHQMESNRRRQAAVEENYDEESRDGEQSESNDESLFVSEGPRRRKKRKTSKQRPEDPRRHVLGSMMNSNIFQDQAANQDAPDLPEIRETRKADALKQLLNSVSKEHRSKAITEKKELYNASRKFKPAARPDGNGGWKVTGMTSSLKNYQLVGGGFMRERENDEQRPFGGICADVSTPFSYSHAELGTNLLQSMGLGKTVVMIANIINSRPKKPIPDEPGATLIVLPASLVTQWAREFKKHVKESLKLKVLIYRAGNRPEANDVPEFLARFDAVLTTYYEVQQSYPKTDLPLELQTAEEKNAWWKEYYEEKKGDLHRVKWKRIVLDEAQQIKNFRSRTSLACRALEGNFRWALSGTPIMNSPLELYPYFKFLKVPLTGSFGVFKENYYNHGPNEEPLERLSLMVSRFMIRRTHKDTMFGAPILKLPKASERIHWVKFNNLERGIYEIVHRRMVARVNSFVQENSLERNYRNVLVMLLRLRQMTGNMLMVEVVMKDLLEREDHEKIRELTEIEVPRRDHRRAQLIELRRLLSVLPEEEDPDEEYKDEGTPATTHREATPDTGLMNVPEDRISIGGAHGRTFNFAKYLKDLRKGKQWDEVAERTICVVCRQIPDTPYVTACYHIYCQDCLRDHQHECARQGFEHSRCQECQIEYTWAHPCDGFDLDDIISDAEDAEINAAEAPVKRWRRKQKGQKKKKKKNNEAEATKTWIEKHGTVLPSAKTIAVKAQILNWLEKDPACKILIYTQFLSMVEIMKKICSMENWSCKEYTGRMSVATRDKALEEFKQGNASILLASLKCGGLGLNITQAKHVISIDPWWNWAVEQQAFCRVFRIGQEAETSMTRFVVEGTIDEKLIAMQDRKQKEIDHIMGDKGERRDAPTMHEMLRLFGQVGRDEEGRPFVAVEDKDTLPRVDANSEDECDDEWADDL